MARITAQELQLASLGVAAISVVASSATAIWVWRRNEDSFDRRARAARRLALLEEIRTMVLRQVAIGTRQEFSLAALHLAATIKIAEPYLSTETADALWAFDSATKTVLLREIYDGEMDPEAFGVVMDALTKEFAQ